MKYLPALVLAILLVAALVAGAWGRPTPGIEEGRFRAEPEQVTEASDLIVMRLKIVSRGAGGIRASLGDGNSSWLSVRNAPRSQTEAHVAHLVFVADKSLDLGTERCSITWLDQITTPGGARVGGPSRYVVPRDTKLEEYVQLDLPEGEYVVGKTLQLGTVGGEPLRVTVEGLDAPQER